MTVGAAAAPEVGLSASARLEQIGPIVHPTKRDEAWRYAPHAALARLTFGPAMATDAGVPDGVEQQIPALDGPRIVLVNGVVDTERSNLADLPPGVRIASLADALNGEHQERLIGHFGAAIKDPADAFVALNAAYGSDGGLIEVAEGHHVADPIHIVEVVVPAPAPAPNASCAGVVIHLGDGSSATVVETRIGGGDEFGGSNTRTTITLGVGATLEHIVLQDAPASQIHLGRFEVTQAAGSDYRTRSFNLGASYGRLAYDVSLAGEGARADLSGLYFGLGDQVLDQQIMVTHQAVDCTSRQSFRGVLDDASTGVFNGGIAVSPGANGTDAEQSNDNLLLSKRAEVNTQPRLEILADEVACKHGATVGQLDDTALYYLRSRGIAADEARRLLISGFAEQALDDVGNDVVRSWIAERLGHPDA